MRFVLDEDIDVEVARRLRQRGHDAWSIPEAGLAGEPDDDVVSVYADDKGAVLITCDVALIKRRTENPFGKHIQLRGPDPTLADVVTTHHDALVELLERAVVIIVSVSADGARILYPRHLQE